MRFFAAFILAGLISLPTFFIHWFLGWVCLLSIYYITLKAIQRRKEEIKG